MSGQQRLMPKKDTLEDLRDRIVFIESEIETVMSTFADLESEIEDSKTKLHLAEESFDIVARLEEFAFWVHDANDTPAAKAYASDLLERLIQDAKFFQRKAASLIS
jgi:hypothetical protein